MRRALLGAVGAFIAVPKSNHPNPSPIGNRFGFYWFGMSGDTEVVVPAKNQTEAQRSGLDLERRSSGMSALRLFVKMSEQAIHSLLRHGAGGRTRTGTPSLAVDFESTTSTNSITPACNVAIIIYKVKNSKNFFYRRRKK